MKTALVILNFSAIAINGKIEADPYFVNSGIGFEIANNY